MDSKAKQRRQLTKKLRTLWHPLLYQLQRKVLIPRNTEVEYELDGSEQPPKIDLLLRHNGKRWSEEQRAVLPDGVRDRHCQHHLFEFKITESVNIRAFKQADMYDYLYPELKKVKDHEFQTYIVSSRTTLEENLNAWNYKQTEYPGVYESTHPRFEYIVLLLLNELRDLPHNNYFRLFASQSRVRESALESLLQTHAPHLDNDPTEEEIINAIFAVGKAYNIEVEGLEMEKGLTVEWLLERGDDIRRSFIKAASLEERLAGVTPEHIREIYTPEQVIGAYKPEQVLGMYKPEQVLGMYKPEQVLGMYKPEERIGGLKPEQVLGMYKPEERMVGLKPEQVLGAYKPDQLIDAYTLEEKRLLMEALQRSMEMDEAAETAAQQDELEERAAEQPSDSPPNEDL